MSMGTVLPFRNATASKTSVLVVDDDPQVIRVMMRILDRPLYQVRTAMNKQEALLIADAASPDFVLLDLHLSYPACGDGLECLKELRATGYLNPIFMVSADPSIDQAHEAARLGANGYLIKCDPERFLERLNTLLLQSMEESAPSPLPPSAAAYFETRGLSRTDIALLSELTRASGHEGEAAASLRREEDDVRLQLESICRRLGARTQTDLGRIIGVLSCFAPIHERFC